MEVDRRLEIFDVSISSSALLDRLNGGVDSLADGVRDAVSVVSDDGIPCTRSRLVRSRDPSHAFSHDGAGDHGLGIEVGRNPRASRAEDGRARRRAASPRARGGRGATFRNASGGGSCRDRRSSWPPRLRRSPRAQSGGGCSIDVGGGGTVIGPSSRESSSSLRRERVPAQYFGASSRYRSRGQSGTMRTISAR